MLKNFLSHILILIILNLLKVGPSLWIMVVKHPCGICQKSVGVKHKAICCDICNRWIHTACNNLDRKTYSKLQESNKNWFCITCIKKEIPFASQIMNSKIFIVVGILHFLKVKILNHLLPKLTTELMKTLKRSPKNPYIMTSMNLIILKLQKNTIFFNAFKYFISTISF